MSSPRTWSSPNCVAVVSKDSLASAIEPKCGHSHRCRGSRRSFHHLAALPDNQGEAKGMVLTSDIACGTPSRALVATCEWQGFVRPASRMSVLLHTPVIFAHVQCHSRRESPAVVHLRQQKPRRARRPGTRGDDGSANSRSQLRGLPCSRRGELAALCRAAATVPGKSQFGLVLFRPSGKPSPRHACEQRHGTRRRYGNAPFT